MRNILFEAGTIDINGAVTPCEAYWLIEDERESTGVRLEASNLDREFIRDWMAE